MEEIVDGKDGSDPPEPGISCRRRTKEGGDQGRMPVVHVNDVGPEIRGREHVQDGLAKESEPLPVVVILIDLRTIVEVRFVHEIDRDASDPRHSEAPLLAVLSCSCFTRTYHGSWAMVAGPTGSRGSTRPPPSVTFRSSGS